MVYAICLCFAAHFKIPPWSGGRRLPEADDDDGDKVMKRLELEKRIVSKAAIHLP